MAARFNVEESKKMQPAVTTTVVVVAVLIALTVTGIVLYFQFAPLLRSKQKLNNLPVGGLVETTSLWSTPVSKSVAPTPMTRIIIVGAGTAGCLIARLLAENSSRPLDIVIFERGSNLSNDSQVSEIQKAAYAAYNPPYSLVFKSAESIAGVPNQSITVGTMTGGSSSHNYALTVRGSQFFYENYWPADYLTWSEVLQFSSAIETYHGSTETPNTRGANGPLQVTQLPLDLYQTTSTALSQLIATAVIATLPQTTLVDDYNNSTTATNSCVSLRPQLFMNNQTIKRSSAFTAFLPFLNNNNTAQIKNSRISMQLNTNVNRLSFENGKFTAQWSQDAFRGSAQADIVVLCAGAIFSPVLIQQSFPRPNSTIGTGLKTHYGPSVIVQFLNGSPFADTQTTGPAFIDLNPNRNERRWQLQLLSGVFNPSLVTETIPKGSAVFSFLLWNLYPRSVGTVRSSSDAKQPPNVDLGLFSDGGTTDPQSDLSLCIDGLTFLSSLIQNINKQTPVKLLFPNEVDLQNAIANNRRDVSAEVVKRGVSITDHYSCTCAWNREIDPLSWNVKGVPGLFVGDASLLPQPPDANTQFPVLISATKLAKTIVAQL